MMWFFALVIVVLIGAVAVVASGRWGSMAEVYDDRPDVLVPARHALSADDIESSRFAIGVRGYRMDEVDTLLERVAREVAERDRRIADLERAVSPLLEGPGGASYASSEQAGAPDAAYEDDEVVTYAEAAERYDAEQAPAAETSERYDAEQAPATEASYRDAPDEARGADAPYRGDQDTADQDGLAEGETATRRP